MIRIRFFGPGELIQNGFSGAQYTSTTLWPRNAIPPLTDYDVSTLTWFSTTSTSLEGTPT